MAKKARQRISYVLELPNSSPGGHRLGVNGLAIDRDNAILYSGGRDGVVCAWDIDRDLVSPGRAAHSAVIDTSASRTGSKPTRFRVQTQAHTHWINDIALAQQHNAVVSASSDLLVKLWRPHGSDSKEPATIGQHADYVKCVATPDQNTNWVASGGLDRKIYLWDLAGGGKTLEIDVSGEEVTEKGSVYALSVTHSILASGGPESIVRLWDPKTGKRITKFVGHTDNIRSVLVNQSGDMVMTASSDQTVKVWSVTAGRCMHTLTMHNDSVWSLYSEEPDLGIFYSSDRSGLVVKTDVRGTFGELDDGLSVAVAQENDGVSKVVAAGECIWTATSRSSINRWRNVDTTLAELPNTFKQHRASVASSRSRESSLPSAPSPPPVNGSLKREISAKSILRISNTASFPPSLNRDGEESSLGHSRKGSEILPDPVVSSAEPIHQLPEETIEGQFGLVKHRLLNDRRRVLTLDTAGDVLLWDLIRCQPIKSFGKRHLEDVEPEINTLEAVAPWCSIDTSSGNLTVVLEPFNCFDAEMYADELTLEEPVEFREDQRINLGKWVLRYLFANLIDEEIRRDEAYRQKLNEPLEKKITVGRMNPPLAISIPPPPGWVASDSPGTTPRANGMHYPPMTPGMAILSATPGSPMAPVLEGLTTPTPLTPLDRRLSQVSRPSQEREDYFSDAIHSPEAPKPAQTPAVEARQSEDKAASKTPGENGKDKEKDKDSKDKEKDGKAPSTPFGKKKFRMNMSFGSMKLGRSASTTAADKPAVVDERAEESESSSNHEKEFEDNFLGVIQRMRNEYDKQLVENPDNMVETRITPSLPNDTPVLKLPAGTKVIIQEETSGGSAELYRGTVATVGLDADVIEKRGPQWLGEVVLLNTVPPKDPVKVSFVLYPWRDELPPITAADGNNRLNANRMLRVKKILAYVAERIDPQPQVEGEEGAVASDKVDENGEPVLRPEEYLELYCNDQLLPNTMSLATLRAHVWKGGNDIVLHYKANGRKKIPFPRESGEGGGEEGTARTSTSGIGQEQQQGGQAGATVAAAA